jgi:hypothetical protein
MHVLLSRRDGDGTEAHELGVEFIAQTKAALRDAIADSFVDEKWPSDLTIEVQPGEYQDMTIDHIDDVMLEGFCVGLRSDEWEYTLHVQYQNKENDVS